MALVLDYAFSAIAQRGAMFSRGLHCLISHRQQIGAAPPGREWALRLPHLLPSIGGTVLYRQPSIRLWRKYAPGNPKVQLQ